MKKLVTLIILLLVILPKVNHSYNVISTKNEFSNRLYLTVSAGFHTGDDRFRVQPIIFFGTGYYLTNGIAIKAEYVPVEVSVKNNNYPLFTYKGTIRKEGDKFNIETYFISIEGKIYKNLWINLGFAPEKLFSVKTGVHYNHEINKNIIVFAEYNLLMVGRPINNSKNQAFISNSFTLGVHYFLF